MTEPKRRRRHSPAVYRRRRLVALLVLLLIAGGVAWLLIAQPWRSAAAEQDPKPSATASESPTPESTLPATTEPTPTPTDPPRTAPPEPAPDPAATVAATKPCISRDIEVEPVTDAESYAAGQNPQLSIRLTNDGDTDCTLNVGTSTQVYTVTSGDDVWWRSTDCQTEPSDMIVTLAAGQSVTSATPLVWDRARSSVSTCDDSNRQTAPGGGASYRVSVEIGGIGSSQEKQILLY